MKVLLIQKAKDEYKEALISGRAKPDGLFRRCISQWHTSFTLDEMRLGGIIDLSLKNKESGRYWGGERHSIKSSLITLANHNPDLFWEAIKDLLNEDRMLIMRANRFIHHCDVIFADYKKKDLKANTHHQDYYSASLLLALHHPQHYCLFQYEEFANFCRKIEVNDLPVNTDLERYYKILRAVQNILSKDEEFMNIYYSKLEEDVYLGPSLDMARELMLHVR